MVHLGEGEVEGEGRFGALVLVDAILVKPVAAAAGGRIVEREAEVVAAEEPLEGAPRFLEPRWSLVARKASRQAETMAQASSGC